MYELCVDFSGLFTYALNVQSGMKRCSNKLSVHSEPVQKPHTEYIKCLHPGALKTHVWNHVSDAPGLAFASMSHFK